MSAQSDSDPVTRQAEVVIIGGGVMGTSIAYHLAKAGVRDVVLLERDELASESSGKPLGGVRAQFSDRVNIELGVRSLAAFRRFPEEVGPDIGLQAVGYLFIFRDAADMERYQPSVELQNSLGVDSRFVSAEKTARLSPYVDAGRVVGAAWSPSDGFARPEAAVNGYADAASGLGVEVRTGSPVIGIDRVGERAAVRVGDGSVYETPTLVCCWRLVQAGCGDGRSRPADRAAAAADRLHRGDGPPSAPGAVHHRLLHHGLLPRERRWNGAADRDGRPAATSRITSRRGTRWFTPNPVVPSH